MPKSLTISFPLADSPEGYLLKTETVTSRAVSSELLLLLSTQRGERYFYPEYGTDLRKYLFEQNDKISSEAIQNEIQSSVSRFIPNLTIDNIDVNQETDYTILLDVYFTYNDNFFSDSGVLSIRFKS